MTQSSERNAAPLSSVLISLMDRVRTNATLFAEHSARIKRTLRRALDTRVVSRSTMTPISPTSVSTSRLSLPLSLFVIASRFFSFYVCSFFYVLVFFFGSIVEISFSACRFCCDSLRDVFILILPFYPTLTYFKYSAIYVNTLWTTLSSFALSPLVINLQLHPVCLSSVQLIAVSSFHLAVRNLYRCPTTVSLSSISLSPVSYSHQELPGLARN